MEESCECNSVIYYYRIETVEEVLDVIVFYIIKVTIFDMYRNDETSRAETV